MADAEEQLLAEVAEHQIVPNSSEYAASHSIPHDKIVGIIKSLQAAGLIDAEVKFAAAASKKRAVPSLGRLSLLYPCDRVKCTCCRNKSMQAMP